MISHIKTQVSYNHYLKFLFYFLTGYFGSSIYRICLTTSKNTYSQFKPSLAEDSINKHLNKLAKFYLMINNRNLLDLILYL